MSDDQTSPRKQAAEVISSIWWVLLLRGLLLAALGVYALIQPGVTLAAFTKVLGIFVLADGCLAIVAGILGWTESRWWTLLRGVLGILVGGFVIAHPIMVGVIAATVIACVIGVESIIAGFLEISAAIRERKEIQGGLWWILSGVFSILFGILCLVLPFASSLIMIRLIGAFAILFGIELIVSSFQVRKVGKKFAAA